MKSKPLCARVPTPLFEKIKLNSQNRGISISENLRTDLDNLSALSLWMRDEIKDVENGGDPIEFYSSMKKIFKILNELIIKYEKH